MVFFFFFFFQYKLIIFTLRDGHVTAEHLHSHVRPFLLIMVLVNTNHIYPRGRPFILRTLALQRKAFSSYYGVFQYLINHIYPKGYPCTRLTLALQRKAFSSYYGVSQYKVIIFTPRDVRVPAQHLHSNEGLFFILWC